MEILYNLAQNFLEDVNKPMPEKEFMNNASEILKAAQTRGETTVEDEATGICSIMCKNKMSVDEIKIGLDLCKDKDGLIDEDLAEMLWNMCLQNADIGEIADVISNCKDSGGNIDRKQIQFFLSEQTDISD